MIPRNPKQEGTCLWDCKPQQGPCPNDCNQCFYNRPGAFYVPIEEPIIPDSAEVGDGIVRMNCGHDSNIEREKVIEAAGRYRHVFYSTPLPRFDFPSPVVFTANPVEEKRLWKPGEIEQLFLRPSLDNLMFVRLRVSLTNRELIQKGVLEWAVLRKIPVVLTFMAYYDQLPPGCYESNAGDRPVAVPESGQQENPRPAYVWKKRTHNSYWCPTSEFKAGVLSRMRASGGTLVSMCGTSTSNRCRDCRNCETYYVQTMKRLGEIQ
jgi:hypothetical protein